MEALKLYERALKLRKEQRSEDDPILAKTLTAMADVAAEQAVRGGNTEENVDVLTLYKEALEIRLRSNGPEHPDVAVTLNSMANFYAEVGNGGA